MNLRDKLLEASKRYCDRTGKSPATLSTALFNDGKRLESIEKGGDCTTGTYEAAMKWLRENTPAET